MTRSTARSNKTETPTPGVQWMIPGRRYRVTYESDSVLRLQQGTYIGREVTRHGDHLVFDDVLLPSEPREIPVESVTRVYLISPLPFLEGHRRQGGER